MQGISKKNPPWRITFDTNPGLCNLHCVMCEEHSEFAPKMKTGQNRIMPFEIIETVLAEAASFSLKEIIPSTMGEPLLYKDFGKILELCKSYNIKLNLTTNGTFPRPGAKGWAEMIVPLASDVKISWNGAVKETYEAIMKGSVWETSLQNVKDFIAVRNDFFNSGGDYCRVTFQLTFMEKNTAELADMVKLAIDLGVDRVKGHHLWVNFAEMQDDNMRRNPDSVKRWNSAVIKALEAVDKYRFANGNKILLENIFELKPGADATLAENSVCPFLGQEAWINTKGEFAPCCAPDELRRTLGDFGCVNEKGFFEIWNSKEYMELCENYKNIDLCKKCNMRKPYERKD